MSYREPATFQAKHQALALTTFSLGIVLLAVAAYYGMVVNPNMRLELVQERDAKVIAYIERIDARFNNDSGLTAHERIEILKDSHMLSADDLGNIESIRKDYDQKISSTWNDYGPLAMFVMGFAFCGFAGLYAEIKLGGW